MTIIYALIGVIEHNYKITFFFFPAMRLPLSIPKLFAPGCTFSYGFSAACLSMKFYLLIKIEIFVHKKQTELASMLVFSLCSASNTWCWM